MFLQILGVRKKNFYSSFRLCLYKLRFRHDIWLAHDAVPSIFGALLRTQTVTSLTAESKENYLLRALSRHIRAEFANPGYNPAISTYWSGTACECLKVRA